MFPSLNHLFLVGHETTSVPERQFASGHFLRTAILFSWDTSSPGANVLVHTHDNFLDDQLVHHAPFSQIWVHWFIYFWLQYIYREQYGEIGTCDGLK
jgi:hypothetical protein